MVRTKKEQAIKKLQTELKEEKLAEIKRFVVSRRNISGGNSFHPVHNRRKEITLERKKAAEERRRLEEEKAKVRCWIPSPTIYYPFPTYMSPL